MNVLEKIEQLEQQLAELKKEALASKPNRLEMWKPEEDKDEIFHCINAVGIIVRHALVEIVDRNAEQLRLAGNCIETREQAEAHSKRLGVFNRLWRLAEQCELVEKRGTDPDELFINSTLKLLPMFKNEEDIQLVLDSLSDDDKRYLRGEL